MPVMRVQLDALCSGVQGLSLGNQQPTADPWVPGLRGTHYRGHHVAGGVEGDGQSLGHA